jgi:hypothetical protein
MNGYSIPGIFYFTGALGFLFCIYFNAKLIKSVELKKEAKFEEFIGDFFLILFFPIGIWLIQPRLNKIVTNSTNTNRL